MTTKEQKTVTTALRVAASRDRQMKAEFELAENKAKFRASLPKRFKEMQLFAESLDVSTSVGLTEVGPTLRFYVYNDGHNELDITISYESEEWEIDHASSVLSNIDENKKRVARELTLAKDAFALLTPEEQTFVKLYIKQL